LPVLVQTEVLAEKVFHLLGLPANLGQVVFDPQLAFGQSQQVQCYLIHEADFTLRSHDQYTYW
jgi:hypothetical protein